MIVAITTAKYGHALRSLTNGAYGFPVPKVDIIEYGKLFEARRLPRATYIFADLDRLVPWALQIAADRYRRLRADGLRCLNDPARAMCRVELLRTLHAAGRNPFDVSRADEQRRPGRFPVFLRFEMEHGWPLSPPIASQAELDRRLEAIRESGVPLRGVLVVELCEGRYGPDLWHKWGSFRVGEHMSVDHIAVDDTWHVKHGTWEKLTEAAIADEHDAVQTNRFAAELKPVFDIAGIEFGRADHATVDGRSVVYEINTNPMLGRYVPDPKPLRRATQALARQRLADALAAIDTADSGATELDPVDIQKIFRGPAAGGGGGVAVTARCRRFPSAASRVGRIG